MDFSTIEVTSKKVCGNDVDFSTIEITSEKVRGNDVDSRAAKLHRKNTWKRHGNSSKFGIRRTRWEYLIRLSFLGFSLHVDFM